MGIERYEISNFAEPGNESLHNLKYWTMAPYVGFGSDAHGFDGRVRFANMESPQEYVASMLRGQDGRCFDDHRQRGRGAAFHGFASQSRVSASPRPTGNEIGPRLSASSTRGCSNRMATSSGSPPEAFCFPMKSFRSYSLHDRSAKRHGHETHARDASRHGGSRSRR